MIRFFCWKCDAELAVINSEKVLVDAWMQCPNQACQEPNTLTYRFPEAKMEVQ